MDNNFSNYSFHRHMINKVEVVFFLCFTPVSWPRVIHNKKKCLHSYAQEIFVIFTSYIYWPTMFYLIVWILQRVVIWQSFSFSFTFGKTFDIRTGSTHIVKGCSSHQFSILSSYLQSPLHCSNSYYFLPLFLWLPLF